MNDNTNNEENSSLFHLAKECKRLGMHYNNDQLLEIVSPIIKAIETNTEDLSRLITFDFTTSERMREIIEQYRSAIDINMSAINKMMETRFSDLVQPKIYVPGVSSTLLTLSKYDPPWRTKLDVLSTIDTSVLAATSQFRELVDAEKAVASLLQVANQFPQMTSVSAQLASLQNIGLSDPWKKAIIPPDLVLGLNDFAVHQYKSVQKAQNNDEATWRLGLIDVASKYVDEQVRWGSALAIESDGIIPDKEFVTLNLSDLPVFMGSAKRDKRNVEDAFDESQIKTITDMGRLIVQKAKVINDNCKVRNMELLFPEAYLLNWAMVLGSSFCRNSDILNEVMSTLYEMFVREPIIKLIGEHECFDKIDKYRNEIEKKRGIITKIQRNTYKKIIEIEDVIIDSFGEIRSAALDEDIISSNILSALLHIQGNRLFKNRNENDINDFIRDQLEMIYEVKDQTRRGESFNGKDAGEVDIMICDSGDPWAIIEGLKLNGINKKYLDMHINKVLTNYDPIGCKLVYILVYATMKKFDDFWHKLTAYMQNYIFPYEVEKHFWELSTAYSESRHGKVVLNRNGKRVGVHLFAIAID